MTASVVALDIQMTAAPVSRDETRRAASSPRTRTHRSFNQTLWRAARFWVQVIDMAALVNGTFPITQDSCHTLSGCGRLALRLTA